MTTPTQELAARVSVRQMLVPLDGSRLAEAVLPAVLELARRFGAHVTLLHALEHRAPALIHGESHLTDARAAVDYLTRVSESLRDQGLSVEVHVHPRPVRDVAGSIVAHAAESHVDLVVMATHGSGGLRHIIIGSIAEQVIGRGLAPVLLVRPEFSARDRQFAIHRPLVPLDGTPDAERALPLAELVARAWGAELILLRVVPTRETLPGEQAAVATMLPGATSAALEIEREMATEYLDGLVNDLNARGIGAVPEVQRGDPTAVVPEVVGRRDVDLVVMATHGRAGLDAFWSGSMGHRLADRLTVPLLILRSRRTNRLIGEPTS